MEKMSELQKAEVLQQAFNGVVYAYGRSQIDPHGVPRAESVLFDVCIDCGMDHEEPDHIEWAADRINDGFAVIQ